MALPKNVTDHLKSLETLLAEVMPIAKIFRTLWVHAIMVDRKLLFAMGGSREQPANGHPRRDWPLAVLHAFIISMITFWSTLGGVGIAGLLTDPFKGVFVALCPTMVIFFTRLAAELGLEK